MVVTVYIYRAGLSNAFACKSPSWSIIVLICLLRLGWLVVIPWAGDSRFHMYLGRIHVHKVDWSVSR